METFDRRGGYEIHLVIEGWMSSSGRDGCQVIDNWQRRRRLLIIADAIHQLISKSEWQHPREMSIDVNY